MQNFFSAFKGMDAATLRKDRTMYSHSLTVMYSIASLVDNLDDADQLVLLVQKIAHNHVARDVGFKYFEVSVLPYRRASATNGNEWDLCCSHCVLLFTFIDSPFFLVIEKKILILFLNHFLFRKFFFFLQFYPCFLSLLLLFIFFAVSTGHLFLFFHLT